MQAMWSQDGIRHLDLFSGIGGFALALENVFEKVEHVFCEIDPFCHKILNKHWPTSTIYKDVKTLKAHGDSRADIITGGFPCQPFSTAGRRRGTEDDRHLWPQMARIIGEFKPSWVIAENVSGLLAQERGLVFEQVCTDLEGQGYETMAFVIPACSTNAPHKRDRIWIIAHANGERRVKDAFQKGQHREVLSKRTRNLDDLPIGIKQSPPSIRGYDGLSSRLDESRVKALGNAIVPQVAEEIIRGICHVSS